MASEVYKSFDFLTINTVSGLRPPSDPSDAVRLADLEEVASEIREEIAGGAGINKITLDLVGGEVDGEDTIFEITHNFNSMDLMGQVYDKIAGQNVRVEFVRFPDDWNKCQVIFRGNSSVDPSQFRLLILKLG